MLIFNVVSFMLFLFVEVVGVPELPPTVETGGVEVTLLRVAVGIYLP